MDRRYRVRIVIGVWMALIGLAFMYVVPSLVMLIPRSQLSHVEVPIGHNGILTPALAAAATAIIGLMTLVVGVLIAAVSWSTWFIQSSRPNVDTTSAEQL
jgi:hypothetical protein